MNIELLSFFVLSLVIVITPGPSVVYVVSYSLRYGAKAGIVSTLGINTGSIVTILIAAFGLSALLNIYPTAISFIQIICGFYIIYLATLTWPRGSVEKMDERKITKESYKNLFRNGVITSVLNPKDILFYTAFIPTFIPQDLAGGSYQTYFLLLGFSYMTIGFITKSSFAVFSGFTKKALGTKNIGIVNCLSSMTLFALGIYLLGKSISNLL